MGGWTGVGKDRINWKGQIEQEELVPEKSNDLVVKKYVDDADALKLNLDTSNDPLTGSLHIQKSDGILWLENTNQGSVTVNRAMTGLELSSNQMDGARMFTPAIKFMSTDVNFTTENPKFLGMIAGRATEAYNADTDSGMSIDFYTTPNDNGATSIPEHVMTVSNMQRVGIGTKNPGRLFHIVDGGGGTAFRLEATSSLGTLMEFNNTDGSWSMGLGATEAFNFRDTTGAGSINVMTIAQGAPLNSFVIASNGNMALFAADDQKMLWGAASDCSVSYDGVDMVINPQEIGTGGLIIEPKIKLTSLGGYAIKLTNKAGFNSVAGLVVKASSANDDAVVVAAAGDVNPIGVFLDNGVADGSEAWVVVSGIARVRMETNTAATRGYWIAMSRTTNGAAVNQVTPAAAPQHFEEMGHCIESVAAGGVGTNIIARCILHFN